MVSSSLVLLKPLAAPQDEVKRHFAQQKAENSRGAGAALLCFTVNWQLLAYFSGGRGA